MKFAQNPDHSRARTTVERSFDPLHGLMLALILLVAGGSSGVSANGELNIQGGGYIEWVTDGDTARVHTATLATVQRLRAQAVIAQRRYNRRFDLERIYRTDPASPSVLIRVANINTAESVHRDSARNSQAGIRASAFAKAVFTGDSASIDCHTIGYYGRPVCNIISDQDGDWAKVMIERGFSGYVIKYGRHPDAHWHQVYRQAAGEH